MTLGPLLIFTGKQKTMVYFEIHRKVGPHWVVIRTHVATMGLVKILLLIIKAENPNFEYRVRRVEVTEVEAPC